MARTRRSTNYGDRPDLFTRYKKLDTSQLGTIFHGYLYKNLIPLQASTGKNFTYDMIRLDYLLDKVPSELYDDERVFFRTPLKDFELDKMIDACEKVYQVVKGKVRVTEFEFDNVNKDKICTPLDRPTKPLESLNIKSIKDLL